MKRQPGRQHRLPAEPPRGRSRLRRRRPWHWIIEWWLDVDPVGRGDVGQACRWGMDGDAKRQAIEGGKIKGVIEEREHHGSRIAFTDTTEDVARFVAGAGDGLFSKDVLRLERVK